MGYGTYIDQDESGILIDIKKYQCTIDSLLYLTTSYPDIMFSVCLCVHFQVIPKESHLTSAKWIINYLKGTKNVGLWYLKVSVYDLVGYFDSDYVGCKIDWKNTSETCHILGNALVSWSYKK